MSTETHGVTKHAVQLIIDHLQAVHGVFALHENDEVAWQVLAQAAHIVCTRRLAWIQTTCDREARQISRAKHAIDPDAYRERRPQVITPPESMELCLAMLRESRGAERAQEKKEPPPFMKNAAYWHTTPNAETALNRYIACLYYCASMDRERRALKFRLRRGGDHPAPSLQSDPSRLLFSLGYNLHTENFEELRKRLFLMWTDFKSLTKKVYTGGAASTGEWGEVNAAAAQNIPFRRWRKDPIRELWRPVARGLYSRFNTSSRQPDQAQLLLEWFPALPLITSDSSPADLFEKKHSWARPVLERAREQQCERVNKALALLRPPFLDDETRQQTIAALAKHASRVSLRLKAQGMENWALANGSFLVGLYTKPTGTLAREEDDSDTKTANSLAIRAVASSHEHIWNGFTRGYPRFHAVGEPKNGGALDDSEAPAPGKDDPMANEPINPRSPDEIRKRLEPSLEALDRAQMELTTATLREREPLVRADGILLTCEKGRFQFPPDTATLSVRVESQTADAPIVLAEIELDAHSRREFTNRHLGLQLVFKKNSVQLLLGGEPWPSVPKPAPSTWFDSRWTNPRLAWGLALAVGIWGVYLHGQLGPTKQALEQVRTEQALHTRLLDLIEQERKARESITQSALSSEPTALGTALEGIYFSTLNVGDVSVPTVRIANIPLEPLRNVGKDALKNEDLKAIISNQHQQLPRDWLPLLMRANEVFLTNSASVERKDVLLAKVSSALEVFKYLAQDRSVYASSPDLVFTYAELLKVVGRHEDAIEVLGDLQQARPTDPRPVHFAGYSELELAIRQKDAKRIKKALELFDRAIEIFKSETRPDSVYSSYAKAHYNKYLALRKLNEWEPSASFEQQATHELSKFKELTELAYKVEGRKNPNVTFTLAVLRATEERWDEALDLIESSMLVSPSFVFRAGHEPGFAPLLDPSHPNHVAFVGLLREYEAVPKQVGADPGSFDRQTFSP